MDVLKVLEQATAQTQGHNAVEHNAVKHNANMIGSPLACALSSLRSFLSLAASQVCALLMLRSLARLAAPQACALLSLCSFSSLAALCLACRRCGLGAHAHTYCKH